MASGRETAALNGTDEQMVMVAINLGWQLAEIYALVRPDELGPPPEPIDQAAAAVAHPDANNRPRARLQPDLPGASGLTAGQQLQLKFDQVDVWARQLAPKLSDAGLAVPDSSGWPALSRHRHSAEGRYELAAAILEFHCDTLTRLTAADYRLGRAYGLGRALADLSLRPQAASWKSFTEDLRFGRVQTISSWLGELRTVLPDHAAGAVQGSIAQWQAWAANPPRDGVTLHVSAERQGADGADQPQGGGMPQGADQPQGASAVDMLREQGRRWRSLLTGQVGPLDELAPEDFVDAADYLLGRIRAILLRVLAQYWRAVMAGMLIMIAAVVGAFFVFTSPVGKSIGAAFSFLAWFGITGKLVSAALQRAVGQAEESLWQGELDLAVARAITQLPGGIIYRALGEPAPTSSRPPKAIGLGRATRLRATRLRATPATHATGASRAARAQAHAASSAGMPPRAGPVAEPVAVPAAVPTAGPAANRQQ